MTKKTDVRDLAKLNKDFEDAYKTSVPQTAFTQYGEQKMTVKLDVRGMRVSLPPYQELFPAMLAALFEQIELYTPSGVATSEEIINVTSGFIRALTMRDMFQMSTDQKADKGGNGNVNK